MKERFIVLPTVCDMYEVYDIEKGTTEFVNDDRERCEKLAERKNKKVVDEK